MAVAFEIILACRFQSCPRGVSLEEILAEFVELRRVAAQAEQDHGAGTATGCGFVELLTSTFLGCAVGKEPGEEALVTRSFRA